MQMSMSASGGTITVVGNSNIHTFTTIGGTTFTVNSNIHGAQILIVAGGGGAACGWQAGGGGAGGYLYYKNTNIATGTYTINIGKGGIGGGSNVYPPGALTSASGTFTGLSYGNGTYTASASSNYDASQTAWKAFSKRATFDFWTTSTQCYGGTSVNPAGGPYGYYLDYPNAFSTTVQGATGYASNVVPGEWVQIACPSAITVRSYSVHNSGGSTGRSPNKWVLAGSNDGTTWYAIDLQDNWYTFPDAVFQSLNGMYAGTSYSYYRICINRINWISALIYPFGHLSALFLYDVPYAGYAQNGESSNIVSFTAQTLTTVGGGRGGGEQTFIGPGNYSASNGGSGGGASWINVDSFGYGTSGQGTAGGSGFGNPYVGGGGGGAYSSGTNATSVSGGSGGDGQYNTITGSVVAYSGGGAGTLRGTSTVVSGGLGGGGSSVGNTTMGSTAATSRDATYYGGGGGATGSNSNGNSSRGGNGYQGIIIIRYTQGSTFTYSNVNPSIEIFDETLPANLFCWLDASQTSSLTIDTRTDVVTKWVDIISGLTFTGGTPRYLRTAQYSPGIGFYGGTYLQTSSFTQNLANAHAVVAVVSRVYGGNIFYKGVTFNSAWGAGGKKWWFGDSTGTNEQATVGLYPSWVGYNQNYKSSSQKVTGDLDVVIWNCTSNVTMDIYMNGVIASGYSATGISTTNDSGNYAIIGGAGPSSNNVGWFTGTLHELRVYSNSLSESEISNLYSYCYSKWYNSFSSLPVKGKIDISGIRNELGGLSSGVSLGQYRSGTIESNPNRITASGVLKFSNFYKTGKYSIPSEPFLYPVHQISYSTKDFSNSVTIPLTTTANTVTLYSQNSPGSGESSIYFPGFVRYNLSFSNTVFSTTWWTTGFTFETWVNYPSFTGAMNDTKPQSFGCMQVNGASNVWTAGANASGYFQMFYWTGSDQFIYSNANIAFKMTTNTWYHVCIQTTPANPSDVYMYLNGVQCLPVNPTSLVGTPQQQGLTVFSFSAYNNPNPYANFYISNTRLVYGENVYPTSGFSVPALPLNIHTSGTTALLLKTNNLYMSSNSQIISLSPYDTTYSPIINFPSNVYNISQNVTGDDISGTINVYQSNTASYFLNDINFANVGYSNDAISFSQVQLIGKNILRANTVNKGVTHGGLAVSWENNLAYTGTGPCLRIPFNDNIVDVIGGSYITSTGTLTFTGGQNGNCAYFNGNISIFEQAKQWLSMPNPVSNPPFSISFWFKPDTTTISGASIMAFGDGVYTDAMNVVYNTDYSIGFYIALPTKWSIANLNTGALSVGTWYHICLTVSSLYVCTLYVNSLQVAQLTGSGNFQFNTTRLSIGGNTGNTNGGFNGYLEEFCLFRGCLTTTQVKSMYDLNPFYNKASSVWYSNSECSWNFYNWARSIITLNKSGANAPLLSGAIPDYQYRLGFLSGSTLNYIYFTERLQDYKKFVLNWEQWISGSADGFFIYIGPFLSQLSASTVIEANGGSGFIIDFQIYTSRTRGIYLFQGTTQRAFYSTLSHIAAAWQSCTLTYTKGVTNTWNLVWNGTSVWTYSDSGNNAWLGTSGPIWGFGFRDGGAVGQSYVRRVQLFHS